MTASTLDPSSPPETLLTVPLRNVVMDPVMQSREAMQSQRVRDYENAYRNGSRLPPVRAVVEADRDLDDFEGDCGLVLIDGWHRMQALRNIGAEEVEVLVVRVPANSTAHLLRWLGGRENFNHGVALSREDKRSLFKDYVKAGLHRKPMGLKSYREIAKDMPSVSHQTIERWMREDFPAVATKMGKDEESGECVRSGPPPATEMPSLDGRETQMILEDLFVQAQASGPRQRRTFITQLRQFLERLESGGSYLQKAVQR